MIDELRLRLKGGDGGHGYISFHREKFVPRGGPDGGDGGRGGDLVLRAVDDVYALEKLRPRKLYEAGRGGNGAPNKRHGAGGEDLVVEVPVGTVVLARAASRDGEAPEDFSQVADLQVEGQTAVVARGGRGGWGNVHFATSSNQAPRVAQSGQRGEEVEAVLELRLISDVGVVGLPNAGKSTLLRAMSAAKPRVGAYPFTTLEPTIGVVQAGFETFRVADLPGLIEGAAEGKGLGHEFLRHATRCSVLLQLVDGSGEDPLGDVLVLREELANYDPALAARLAVVAVNKVDLPEVRERQEDLRQAFRSQGMEPRFISAQTGEGVRELTKELLDLVKADRERRRLEAERQPEVPVLRPRPRRRFEVLQEDGEWVVDAPTMETFVDMMDLGSEEARAEVFRRLQRWGVSKALERKGAQPGDTVRIGRNRLRWLE